MWLSIDHRFSSFNIMFDYMWLSVMMMWLTKHSRVVCGWLRVWFLWCDGIDVWPWGFITLVIATMKTGFRWKYTVGVIDWILNRIITLANNNAVRRSIDSQLNLTRMQLFCGIIQSIGMINRSSHCYVNSIFLLYSDNH